MSNFETHYKTLKKDLAKLSSRIPDHRNAFKKKNFLHMLDPEEQYAFWKKLWRTESDFFIKIHAFFFLESQLKKKEFLFTNFTDLTAWQKSVDNWAECDALAKIYTKALEILPEEMYAQLQIWNQSKNLWERRQSVVSLLYFSRTKKIILPFAKIKSLILPLLNDQEYYVQKGLGWCIKELSAVYPAESENLLKKIVQKMHPIAYAVALEKVSNDTKRELSELRKNKG